MAAITQERNDLKADLKKAQDATKMSQSELVAAQNKAARELEEQHKRFMGVTLKEKLADQQRQHEMQLSTNMRQLHLDKQALTQSVKEWKEAHDKLNVQHAALQVHVDKTRGSMDVVTALREQHESADHEKEARHNSIVQAMRHNHQMEVEGVKARYEAELQHAREQCQQYQQQAASVTSACMWAFIDASSCAVGEGQAAV